MRARLKLNATSPLPSGLRDRPLNLAVFRLSVTTIVLLAPEVHHAAERALLDPSLQAGPWEAVPISFAVARLLHGVLVIALLFGGVGLWTRASLTVATLSALVLLGVGQRGGAVLHNHHLVWFLALLAASPSGDALSIDAWRRGHLLPRGRGIAYGVPIFSARLLIGFIFLFPGLAKLHSSGWAWIASDNLRNQAYAKWFEHGVVPSLRLDHVPLLFSALALAAIAFELCFWIAIAWRKTRGPAVLVALGFHAFNALYLGIHFTTLWLTYLVFFDVDRLCRRGPLRRFIPQRGLAPPIRSAIPGLVVAGLLLTGASIAGLRRDVDGWPFACYPSFEHRIGTTLPTLDIEIEDEGWHFIPRAQRTEAEWGQEWSVLARPTPERLRAFLMGLPGDFSHARAARFYRAIHSTVPEEHDRPPDRQLLDTLEMGIPRARSGSITFPASDREASER